MDEHTGRSLDQRNAVLRRWAEGRAEDTIEWYLADKRAKRIGSRVLKALTIVLLIGGSIVPLASAAASGQAAGWGYVMLAGAGGCAAFDHFFGLSAGWMRDMTAVQAIQRRLSEFRLDWIQVTMDSERGGISTRSADPVVVMDALQLIRRFILDLDVIIEKETGDWQSEFGSKTQDLYGQARLAGVEPPRGRPQGEQIR